MCISLVCVATVMEIFRALKLHRNLTRRSIIFQNAFMQFCLFRKAPINVSGRAQECIICF